MLTATQARADLDSFFSPRSIVVFGGSQDAGTIGGRTLDYLRSFQGKVWAIGQPGGPATLESIDEAVDQAIINLPPDQVEATVGACIAKGVRAIVLYSGGFADIGAAGRAAQDRLARLCAAAGVRLLGPNSAGVVSVEPPVYVTYSHSIALARPRPGRIAIVTQSGAVGTFALARGVERGLGFSRFVASGNEADVNIADCIEWLADDDRTGVILVYLEAATDGQRLLRAMARARAAGKPVIVLKGGASDTGAAAAASHTGKLAGADRVYSAALRAAGACRVDSIEEMLDVAHACAHAPLPKGNQLAVITGSGGIGVMMADAAAQYGLVLPRLQPEIGDTIQRLIPLAGVLNPIDTTGQILNDFGLLPRVVETIISGQPIDIVAIFLATVGLDERLSTPLVAALKRLRTSHPDRLLAVCIMATEAVTSELEDAGIVVFDEPSRLIRLLGAMTRLRAPRSDLLQRPGAASTAEPLNLDTWDEARFRRVLEAAGIPFPPFVVVKSAAAAAEVARKFGGPVALKVVSADIAHKSESGGVALGIDPEAVAQAFDAMLVRVTQAAPAARIDGIGVSPMIDDGLETVLGVQRDPVFGPVLLFGLGGIHVESLDDVALRILPIDRSEALEMLDAIRAAPILRGVRGKPPVDREALADALLRLSDFAMAHAETVDSVEINPFLARSTGGVALDALLVPRTDIQTPEKSAHV